MNKLLINLIDDKSTKRKLQILEILSSAEGILTSHDLAKQLNCSSRTITNEIGELRVKAPENWNIKSVKTKGYVLQKPTTESLSSILMSYVQESIIYKILLETFNSNYYSLEKWSQILYMNKSSLRDNLKQFNNSILNANSLEFKVGLVKLNGDEINIRYFYKALFFNIEKCAYMIELPDDLMKKIQDLIKNYNVEIDYLLLKVVIYVSIYRITSKNFVKKPVGFDIIFLKEQLTCFNEIISEIEDYCMIKLPQEEKDTLRLFFFLISYCKNQQKNEILKFYKENNEGYFERFLGLIDILVSNTGGGDIEYDHLKRELGASVYKLNIAKENNLPIEYFITKHQFLSYRLQKLYNECYHITSKWNKEVNGKRYNEHEISKLAQQATNILSATFPKRKVLFLFSGDKTYEGLACTMLEEKFGDSVEIYRNLDQGMRYDLIITNYKKPYPNETPVIFIYQQLNQKDIENINDLLFNKEIVNNSTITI
ncbi:hypothetical protein COE50_06430 [Bacillus anthracis]|nr:hypothetical protein COE50_06430 [Bacillus anthracis]